MARQEEDKEDLIRDAVAFQNRVEWKVPGESGPIVGGLRADGSLSVFFDQDPVYHFNPEGQLRRAYAGGFLFRTHGVTLAKMHRQRTASETTLVRTDLNEQDLGLFLKEMDRRISDFCSLLRIGAASEVRSVTVVEDTKTVFIEAMERAVTVELKLAPPIATRRK